MFLVILQVKEHQDSYGNIDSYNAKYDIKKLHIENPTPGEVIQNVTKMSYDYTKLRGIKEKMEMMNMQKVYNQ